MRFAFVGPIALIAACGRGDRTAAAPAPGAVPGAAKLADASPLPTGVAAAPGDAATAAAAHLPAGLTAERWPLTATPIAGTPWIDVVRADLAQTRLRALTSDGAAPRTALEWRDAEHLIGVINAGMFHASGDPVGLVIADGIARGVDNPKFGGFLAWDPVAPTDPPAVVTGRGCAGGDLAALRARYRSLVQSYRLLGCDGGAIAWKDPKQYSAAAIGLDRAGRFVMLHARGAVTMADLSTAVAAHDLAGALFLEGGPEATLVAGDLALVGSYETGFVENDDNRAFWKLPNVIGLVPIQR